MRMYGDSKLLGATVDGRNRAITTWDVENTVNNGINYQPQLVTAGFQPSTVSWYPMDWN